MMKDILALLILICILGVFWVFVKQIGGGFFKDIAGNPEEYFGKPAPVDPVVESQPEVAEVVVSVPSDIEPEFAISPLIVRQLNQGRATLIMRYRVRKQACTAHLIVWSGAKRRRIQDSYYDLGIIPGQKLDTEVIDEFLALAKARLSELETAGRRTRKAKAVVAESPAESACVEQQQTAVAEDLNQVATPSAATKMKKYPSVYRGTIIEVGMMRQNKNGNEFDVFGVRYKNAEGAEEEVHGANLRTALSEARADVGDLVEILKIGRKTVEAGKAPMNLFSVAKIASM